MKKYLPVLIVLFLIVFGVGGWYLLNKQAQKKETALRQEATTKASTDARKGKSSQTKVDKAELKKRDIQRPAEKIRTKQGRFFLESEAEEFNVGNSYNVQVMVDGAGKIVDGAEFVLKYDPDLLQVNSIQQGSFFSLYPQNKIDQEKGEIEVIALQGPDENKETGEELTVVVSFTPLKQGQTKMLFLEDECHVAGYGGQELLEEVEGMEIEIN